MVWREQSGFVTDCYFCMTNIRGFFRKSKSKIFYSVCKSAIKPVPYDPDLPIPQPPIEKEDTLSVDGRARTGTESEEDLIESDTSFQQESASLFINQKRLNYLVRDLYLCKEKTEVLGSRLQQWNRLEPGTTILSFRSCNQNLPCYYASAENICYCKDIDGLMTELRCEHNSVHSRLYINSSKKALKPSCCTMVISNHNLHGLQYPQKENL